MSKFASINEGVRGFKCAGLSGILDLIVVLLLILVLLEATKFDFPMFLSFFSKLFDERFEEETADTEVETKDDDTIFLTPPLSFLLILFPLALEAEEKFDSFIPLVSLSPPLKFLDS